MSRRSSRKSELTVSRRASHKSEIIVSQKTSHKSLIDMGHRRTSVKQKLVRIYQPTYQLNSKKPFNVEDVEKILKRIVDSELETVEYSDKVVPDLCISLTENIRNTIKEENYDRYRILVAVTIGQRRQQSVYMFHSFLWDHERDRFVSYNFENPQIYANIVVYGIYFD